MLFQGLLAAGGGKVTFTSASTSAFASMSTAVSNSRFTTTCSSTEIGDLDGRPLLSHPVLSPVTSILLYLSAHMSLPLLDRLLNNC